VRFGLFGTGPWATRVHGPALAAHPRAELVGVWGRDQAKTGALAESLSTRPYREAGALLADVDAISVALPPDVQAPIALRAARAGRHLLLEKPVALETGQAEAILTEVSARRLASVVFFTMRFQPQVEAFLRAHAQVPWFAARAVRYGSIFRPGSPARGSHWRRRHGGLWDVGPHALSWLLPALGAVDRVAAMAGPHGLVSVLLCHRGGAVSTMSLTLDAPPAANVDEKLLYGPDGPVGVPSGTLTRGEAFGAAIDALQSQAAGETAGHPCDVRLGRDVVAVLAAADAARTAGTIAPVPVASCAVGPVTGPPADGSR
jgi:predicted dehydrogenase